MQKNRLFFKSLIICSCILGIYNFGLGKTNLAKTISENQWADNRRRAEQFIYSKHTPPVVMVGSSLANCLPARSLPQGTFKLTMAGQSAFDGLTIIQKSGANPKLVLIESNHLERFQRKKFLTPLFNPFFFELKKYLYASRESGRPCTTFLTYSTTWAKKLARSLPKLTSIAHAKNTLSEEETATSKNLGVNRFLEKQIKSHSKAPKVKIISQKIIPILDELSQRGTKIVFFEMPTHPALCSSKHLLAIRTEFQLLCKNHGYNYLPIEDCTPYQTSDGHHLKAESSVKFAAQLIGNLKKRDIFLPKSE